MAMLTALLSGAEGETRRLCVNVLRKHNFQVENVAPSEDLTQRAKSSMPQVCVLDMNVVRKSGVEMLRSLRRVTPETAFILLAARRPGTPLPKALELERVDYVVKPFASYELEHRVRQLLPTAIGSKPHGSEKQKALPAADLHDPATGKLDARRIADYLAVSLKDLSAALQRKYTTVHKSPTSQSLQTKLEPFARVIGTLERVLESQEQVRIWLNQSQPDLGNRTPLAVMLEGLPGAVETIIDSALDGTPG